MARGPRPTTPPTAPSLPQVEFEIIKHKTERYGVNDSHARSYGFNDWSEDFVRPDHYIRYIEPLESDLARQVEYDMDEQDQEWLDAANTERKKDQGERISQELFEIIMDRLEKEWFDLTKNIPRPDFALPSEDSTCAICDDSEGENTNAIVFCDGCNLAVHQDCYGVPYIPEGQWLCRKCTVSPESPVSCVLCPNEGGAFKQTDEGEWVHLLCAIWIPETRVANEVFMEPVTGTDSINKQRWKLKCNICQIREGACIQCTKSSCFAAFHTTCARRDKLLLPMKGAEAVALTAFCEKHLPAEQAQIRETAIAAQEDSEDDDLNENQQTEDPSLSDTSLGRMSRRKAQQAKTARAYAKTYHTGPPLVPQIILSRLLAYIDKVKIRKKTEFVSACCRYWSLKREARRGAPLLKRLHLEPWTSKGGLTPSGDLAGLLDRRMKLEQLRLLRNDLERIRWLTEGCRKREIKKLKQASIVQRLLSQALFPHEPRLRGAFEKIMSNDKTNLFKYPVTKQEAPDYFEIVQKPMSWDAIDEKLDRHDYWDLHAFKDDVMLVFENAFLYNKPGTLHHKTAARLQAQATTIFSNLEELAVVHRAPPSLVHPSSTISQMDDLAVEKDLGPESILSHNQPQPPAQQSKIHDGEAMNIDDQPKEEMLTPGAMFPRELAPSQTDYSRASSFAPPPPTVSSEAATMSPAGFPFPLTTSASSANGAPSPGNPEVLGNLEPPISVLELLRSHESIIHDIDFLIPDKQDPIAYLLDFQFGQSKPRAPTPSPSPPPAPSLPFPPAPEPSAQPKRPRPKTKTQRRDEERAKRAALKAAKEAELNASPGFAVRSTRIILDGEMKGPQGSPGPDAPLQFAEAGPGPSTELARMQLQQNHDNFKLELGQGPPPRTPSPPTNRKGSATPISLPTSPAIVDKIDNKDSFTHFETGWVLPQGSRRGNRVPYEEQMAIAASTATAKQTPPSKEKGQTSIKKPRTAPSRLAKFSTPASENETLAGVEEKESLIRNRRSPELAASGSEPATEPPIHETRSSRRSGLPVTITVDPDGVTVLEQLDTPATRRQRAEQQRQSQHNRMGEIRKKRLAAIGGTQGDSEKAVVSGDVSELSELTEEEEAALGNVRAAETEPEVAAPSSPSRSRRLRKPVEVKSITEVIPDAKGRILPGTLVWAKVQSWPWWPATVQEVDDSEVPHNIAAQVKKSKSAATKLYAVQFFDHGNSWSAVQAASMHLFGVDERLDEDLISPSSVHQRTKWPAQKGKVREAYRLAKDAQKDSIDA